MVRILVGPVISWLIGNNRREQDGSFSYRLHQRGATRSMLWRLAGLPLFAAALITLNICVNYRIPLLAVLAVVLFILGIQAMLGVFSGLRAVIQKGKITIRGVPKAVRHQIIEIEYKRQCLSRGGPPLPPRQPN
jgi:hypothetical protein